MVLFKLLPFFGPFLGFAVAWLIVRHRNPETRRKRAEILLVLIPFAFTTLLFVVVYLIFPIMG